MISLLITLLILCLVFGLIWWLIQTFIPASPFKTVAIVIMVIIAIVVLLSFIPGAPWGHGLSWSR